MDKSQKFGWEGKKETEGQLHGREEDTLSQPFSTGEGMQGGRPNRGDANRQTAWESRRLLMGRGFWGAGKYEGPDKGERALKK